MSAITGSVLKEGFGDRTGSVDKEEAGSGEAGRLAGGTVAGGRRAGGNDDEWDCGKVLDEKAVEDSIGTGGEGSFGFGEGLGEVAGSTDVGREKVVENVGEGNIEERVDDDGGGNGNGNGGDGNDEDG